MSSWSTSDVDVAVYHRGMSRSCPRCHVAFDAVRRPFATIDTCPRCQGIFLDPGEGMALHGADSDPTFLVRDHRGTKVGPSALSCPNTTHASRVMDVHAFGGGESQVEIDHCPSCGGVFLDHGEDEFLEARMSHPPSEHSRPSFVGPPGSNHEIAIDQARETAQKGFFSTLLTSLVTGAAEGLARGSRYGRHRRLR